MVQLNFKLEPAPEETTAEFGQSRDEVARALDGTRRQPRSGAVHRKSMGYAHFAEALVEHGPVMRDWAETLVPPLVAFIAGRYGRKVRMKVGDQEFEASSAKEVKRLVEIAKSLAKDD